MSHATPALIGPDDLQALLGRADVVVLDVRSEVAGGGQAAFEAGHVPGAIRTDYVEDGWRASVGSAPGMLPEASRLEALFGRLGIRPEDHVVVVPSGSSSGDFSVAARIFWTFRAAGHRRLSMLDGGTARWSDEGRRSETGVGRRPSPAAYPVTLDPGVRAELDRVAAIVADGSAALVDSRGLAYFTGEAKSPAAARAGRLPGSVHVDGAGAIDPRDRPAPAQGGPGGPVRAHRPRSRRRVLQHGPGGRHGLVRPGRDPRPGRRAALRRVDVGMDGRSGPPGRDGVRFALLPLALLAVAPPARGRAEEPLAFTVRPSGVEGGETLDEKLARRDRSFRFICIGCTRGPAGRGPAEAFEPLRSLYVPDLAAALRVGDTAPVASPGD